MKNKLDNLFLKIISDKAFHFDEIELNKIDSVSDGLKVQNKQIRAIAEILCSINKSLEEQRMNLRIRNKAEEATLDEDTKKALYRKILVTLN